MHKLRTKRVRCLGYAWDDGKSCGAFAGLVCGTVLVVHWRSMCVVKAIAAGQLRVSLPL